MTPPSGMAKRSRKDFLAAVFQKVLIPLVVFAGSLLPPSAVYAEPFSLGYILGFNGVFQLGQWTPLTVMIENRGKGFKGLLEVETAGGSEYRNDVRRRTYTASVDLPRGSKKTFTFTVFIDSYAHPLIVRLKNGGEILHLQTVNLRNHFVEKPLFLFAGGDPGELNRLPSEEVHPLCAPLAALPSTWYGYQGVQAVVLESSSLSSLTPLQNIALLHWIESGGFLILICSSSADTMLPEGWKQEMEGRMKGVGYRNRLPQLEQWVGSPLPRGHTIPLIQTSFPAAKILLQEGDLPLLTERKKGRGKILFLLFHPYEPPFRNWAGRKSFWEKVLSLGPKKDIDLAPLVAEKIVPLLPSHLPGRFPSFFSVLALVFLYVTAVTVIMKRLSLRTQRRKRLLLLLLSVVITASSLAWISASSGLKHNFGSGNGFWVIQDWGNQSPAQWTIHWGVFSNQDREYLFPLHRETLPAPFFINHNPQVIPFEHHALEEQSGRLSLKFSLQRWSCRFFTYTFFQPSFMEGRASLVQDLLQLELIHNASIPLQEVMMYYKGLLFPLGDIQSGARISSKWIIDPEDFPDEIILPATDQQRKPRPPLSPAERSGRGYRPRPLAIHPPKISRDGGAPDSPGMAGYPAPARRRPSALTGPKRSRPGSRGDPRGRSRQPILFE